MQLFRYPGGKSKSNVRKLIQDHFPKSYSELRDPFVGGGGVPLNMPSHLSRWINDINPDLISVYSALRDRAESFIHTCRSIAPATADEEMIRTRKGTRYPKRLHDLFWQTAHDEQMDPALRYFILNRLGWNGRVMLEPSRRNRMYFSNPSGWNITLGDTLEQAARTLANVRITCGDFAPLFMEPGQGVLVTADPPYVRDSELAQSAKLYAFGFSMEDHKRLRDIAFSSPHSVCMTYDDHPFVRELYRGWNFYPASWHYCGTITNRRQGQELIVTNYPVGDVAQQLAA